MPPVKSEYIAKEISLVRFDRADLTTWGKKAAVVHAAAMSPMIVSQSMLSIIQKLEPVRA